MCVFGIGLFWVSLFLMTNHFVSAEGSDENCASCDTDDEALASLDNKEVLKNGVYGAPAQKGDAGSVCLSKIQLFTHC